MSARTREIAIDTILEHEGGYVDDPEDPGGATHYGITQKTLERVRGEVKGVTLPGHVRDLTKPQARAIYRHDYWRPVCGDALPDGLDIAVVDMAVNQGVSDAVRALQEAAGATVDGVMGPATRKAVDAASVPHLMVDFHALRCLNYARLDPDLVDRYGYGWYRRVMRTYWMALREMV